MYINIPSLDNFDINVHYRRSPIPIGDDDSSNDDGRPSTSSLEETTEDANNTPPSFVITDEKHLQNKQEFEIKILQFKVVVAQA